MEVKRGKRVRKEKNKDGRKMRNELGAALHGLGWRGEQEKKVGRESRRKHAEGGQTKCYWMEMRL